MPIYEYQCESCSRRFEVMQRMTAPPLATCEQCGGPVRRLISQTSFVLKGSGWYVTDYPSESRKKAMSQEKTGGDGKTGDGKTGDAKTGDAKTTEAATTSSTSTASEKVSSSASESKD